MNVIFLDVSGTLCTAHDQSDEMIMKKLKIVVDICKEYNCKVVLSSTIKDIIDEDTLEVYPEFQDSDSKFIVDFLKEEGLLYGRTPTIRRYTDNSKNSYVSVWKEDEIRLFLYRHPEIEHYVVIDDDDMPFFRHGVSDLDKVRKHLVKTEDYLKDNPEGEGLLERHKDEVGEKLKEENEIKKLIYLRDRKKGLVK